MEVIHLVDHLLGSRAPDADPLRSSGGGNTREESAIANDVDRATSEVERARDATHSAVALSSAAAGGNNQFRMSGNEASQVEKGMGFQSPSREIVSHARRLDRSASGASGPQRP